MIQAILFDFNGVIIDDERIHLRAYREVLQEYDVALTDEDYFPCLGMDDVAFTRAAFARAGRELTTKRRASLSIVNTNCTVRSLKPKCLSRLVLLRSSKRLRESFSSPLSAWPS